VRAMMERSAGQVLSCVDGSVYTRVFVLYYWGIGGAAGPIQTSLHFPQVT
jgi:hypothetical protein